jgi:hypothetical protein
MRKVDLTGKHFRLWIVLKKLNKDKNGHTLYQCKNIKTDEIKTMSSNWLFKIKRQEKGKTRRGRSQKWIITKMPYIESNN